MYSIYYVYREKNLQCSLYIDCALIRLHGDKAYYTCSHIYVYIFNYLYCIVNLFVTVFFFDAPGLFMQPCV